MDLSPAEFQAQKRKKKLPEGAELFPLRGFGPSGDFTLYAPPPDTAKSKLIFKDGRPQYVAVGGAMLNAHVRDLRDQVLASFSVEGPGRLGVAVTFLEYAAAVLQQYNDLTDEDLAFLLQGAAWHNGMVEHVCGGGDFLKSVERVAPHLVPASVAMPVYIGGGGMTFPADLPDDPPGRLELGGDPGPPREHWWQFWRVARG